MTSFEERLSKAVHRGQVRGEDRAAQQRAQQLSIEELKKLHTKYRLEFSEHIETCIRQLPSHFPGFQTETLYGDRGWGAACSRDDIQVARGQRQNYYSRLEMTIRPFSDLQVVELTSKGTIRNKELFSRQHFELIKDVDSDTFLHLIDVWVLDYAEQFAATK